MNKKKCNPRTKIVMGKNRRTKKKMNIYQKVRQRMRTGLYQLFFIIIEKMLNKCLKMDKIWKMQHIKIINLSKNIQNKKINKNHKN